MPAFFPRRWPAASPRKPASSWRASPVPVRMAASIARDVEEAKSGKGLKAPAAAPAGAPSIAPSMSDKQIRRAVRRRQLRGDPARRHAPHDCPEADRVGADRSAFLSDDGLRTSASWWRPARRSTPRHRRTRTSKPAYKLSVNDFVIKAMAIALQRIPNANVSWTEGGMLKHKHSDIGVAVAMPGGLITPIIRKAETKSTVGDFGRNEGFRRPRAGAQAQARGISGRHHGRFPTSACTASRISPR